MKDKPLGPVGRFLFLLVLFILLNTPMLIWLWLGGFANG
jgi:hypothetical protein